MNPKQQKVIRKLSKAPKYYLKKDTHHWADYLELLCMINIDGVVSKNDFIDRLRSLSNTNSDKTELEDDEVEEDKFDYKGKFERYANDYFQVVEYRMGAFGDYYPFKLSSDSQRILLKSDLTIKHRVYFFCNYLGSPLEVSH